LSRIRSTLFWAAAGFINRVNFRVRESLKQVLSAQRKCIRCRGNESLTRVTQKIVTATRKQSLKGNVQSPLLFTPGKRGPLTQMRIARGRLKKEERKARKAQSEKIFMSYLASHSDVLPDELIGTNTGSRDAGSTHSRSNFFIY